MRIRYNRIACAALLAVLLLGTTAGCVAGKRAAEQFSTPANVGSVRLSRYRFLIGSSDDSQEGDTGTPETGENETPGSDETETPETDETEMPGTEQPSAAGPGFHVSPVVLAAGGAAAAVLIAVIVIAVILSKKKNAAGERQISSAAPDVPAAPYQSESVDIKKGSGMVQIGRLHNIGRRSVQQDSLGSMALDGGSGAFAVVADGMGGLSGGDQVSQSIVMSMLQRAGSLGPGQLNGELNAMVRSANEEINQKLGANGIYRSGSTVVAVLLRGNVFHWISVGDSRIYLYRGGSLLQLNQEHTYAVELMQRVMNGEITAAEAAGDPQRHGLTSFIGMGKLKYVDASMRPIILQSGDRILLMTDGVFNNLPETAMADTLRRNPDVRQAAKVLEEQVLALQDAAQDNFTAIILGFQG